MIICLFVKTIKPYKGVLLKMKIDVLFIILFIINTLLINVFSTRLDLKQLEIENSKLIAFHTTKFDSYKNYVDELNKLYNYNISNLKELENHFLQNHNDSNLDNNYNCGNLNKLGKNRICLLNDSYCGTWGKDRFFHHIKCKYNQIDINQAKKCLANKTISFFGDSQTRDLGIYF